MIKGISAFFSGQEFIPLFDRPGIGVPQLAYSFRKLTDTYVDPACFSVKRGSDSGVQVINWTDDQGGTQYEIADEDQILSFCGTSEGSVRVIRNQGTFGSNGDLLGRSGVSQNPRVANSGSISKTDGRMQMNFRNNEQRRLYTNWAGSFNAETVTIFMRIRKQNSNSDNRRAFALSNDNITNGSIVSVVSSNNSGTISAAQRYPSNLQAVSTGNADNVNYTVYIRKTPTLIEIGINGAAPIVNNVATANFNVGQMVLGGGEDPDQTLFQFNGTVLEWFCYNEDKSAQRTEIEADMLDFYT